MHRQSSSPSGTIGITWRTEKTGDIAALALQWREQDGPPVEQPARRGFGSRLIEQTICDGLAGTIALQYPIEGFRCEVRVPI